MDALMLGRLGDIGHFILTPLYYAVSGVMLAWHSVWSLVLPSDGGLSWALSIIGLTLTIRAALIPLFVKQIKSSRNMQLIQPKVKELQKKYGHDRERLAAETMALYKETGTNPFASCLPLLLQMPIFLALFRLVDHAAKQNQGNGFLTGNRVTSFGQSEIFGVLPIKASFTSHPDSGTIVPIVAAILVLVMTATTFLTQRQLMSKNMPADAMSGPYAQQQKMLLMVLPVVFAVGGIAFPIGVLFYWVTSNLWTMGQQFYVIRNNPAPGTPAFKAKQDRDARRHPGAADAGGGATTAILTETETATVADRRPAQRAQPKRQPRSQRAQTPAPRKGAGGRPAATTPASAGGSGKTSQTKARNRANQNRNGKKS